MLITEAVITEAVVYTAEYVVTLNVVVDLRIWCWMMVFCWVQFPSQSKTVLPGQWSTVHECHIRTGSSDFHLQYLFTFGPL